MRRETVEVGSCRLTTATWGGGQPEIVLLHDGLGSIAQWRSLPEQLAVRTGRTVLAYDRAGHGESTPVPTGPWPADWLQTEADVLAELIAAHCVERPILVGHSDGGSIALIHAASTAALGAIVTLAAHSWVEPAAADYIADLRADPERIVAGLARHHDAPEAVFEAWSGAWVSDAFRSWDIRPRLGAISAPTLVVQGAHDEYATDAQAIETASAIGDSAQLQLLPDRHHLLHHEDPQQVIDLISDWVR